MKNFSDVALQPQRIVLPILETLPNNPILGELCFFNHPDMPSIMIFTQKGWIPLYMTRNNHWETIIAEKDQKVFQLNQSYETDAKSIVVYKDGRRLNIDTDYAEVAHNIITYKEKDEMDEDIDILGGEKFEFQIFNIKTVPIFDVKAFNRRVV